MIKTIIVLFNFVFKCSFVNETRAIAIVRAGMQANQLVRASDRAGNITNFTENGASKNFFLSILHREVFFNFCVYY